MMRLPDYEILQDREGWYIACCGCDLCRTHRHTSFADAARERARFEAEDAAAAEAER